MTTTTASHGFRDSLLTGLFSLSLILGLSACARLGDEKPKAQEAIDKGLVKNATCKPLPIGIAEKKDELDKSAALAQLVNQGYAIPAEITFKDFWGKNKTSPGYEFTEKGRALIQAHTPSMYEKQPCVRHGRYKVKTVEAIDSATTATGQNVANARVTIEFVPEEWLTVTKTLPEWSAFWQGIKQAEGKQWVYQLLKSGDDLFFSGMGQAL